MKFWIFAGAFVLCAGLLVWGSGQGWFDGERERASIPQPESTAVAKPLSKDEANSELANLLKIDNEDLVEIGHISRPKRDLVFDAPNSVPRRPAKAYFPTLAKRPSSRATKIHRLLV